MVLFNYSTHFETRILLPITWDRNSKLFYTIHQYDLKTPVELKWYVGSSFVHFIKISKSFVTVVEKNSQLYSMKFIVLICMRHHIKQSTTIGEFYNWC